MKFTHDGTEPIGLVKDGSFGKQEAVVKIHSLKIYKIKYSKKNILFKIKKTFFETHEQMMMPEHLGVVSPAFVIRTCQGRSVLAVAKTPSKMKLINLIF